MRGLISPILYIQGYIKPHIPAFIYSLNIFFWSKIFLKNHAFLFGRQENIVWVSPTEVSDLESVLENFA
jgi:hypothetical protein